MMKYYITIFFLLLNFLPSNAQVSWNMELLSQYDDNTIPDNGNNQYAYNDIWGYAANDREYAIVGSAAYIHFFDVTDPYTPILLDQFLGGDTTYWRDIKTYGNYAYAVSEDTEEGLMIFDLSDLPNSVALVSQTTSYFNSAHNIFIDEANGRLYSAGADALLNGLIVLDIASNPTAPPVIGNDTLIGGYVHDVYVRDNIAYCSHGDEGFYIWDYTYASDPQFKASASTNGYNHSSWLSEDGSFAIFAEEVPPGLPLGIADLSEVDNEIITITKYFQFPLITDDDKANTPHNPFIMGNYAYVSYYEDGVQVIDLSDPTNPVLVGYFDTFPNNNNYAGYWGCWGVYPFLPSGNIIASDRKYGLHVIRFDETLSSTKDIFKENEVAIFPNPSSDGNFNLLVNNFNSNDAAIEVIDLSGTILFQQLLTSTSEQIDLGTLPNGFYFGKIKDGEREIIKKLVISK